MIKVKYFILGVIFTMISSLYIISYATTENTLTFAWNTVKIKINNSEIKQDNFIYNGITYVPLRHFSGKLSKEVFWNAGDRTIFINDKGYVEDNSSSIEKPCDFNIMQRVHFNDNGVRHLGELYIEEILRGDSALKYIKLSNNPIDNLVFDDYEFLLAKINFKLLSSDEKIYNLRSYKFSLISDSGDEYNYVPININSKVDKSLDIGDSSNGWVLFEVNIDDEKPKIVFGRNNDGSGGAWFKGYM